MGLSLTELGKLRGKDPYEATFDLLMEEENAVGMVDFYGTEEHVQLFMKRPEMNACTDGLLGGKPHPAYTAPSRASWASTSARTRPSPWKKPSIR